MTNTLYSIYTKRKHRILQILNFLTYKGFKISDEASNGIQLWYLSFKDSVSPKFKSCAKECHIEDLALSYIIQANVLFNAKYVPIIENVSKEQNIEFKAIHIDTKEKGAECANSYHYLCLIL